MRQYSENKNLQSLLENLITSYETEVNYNPLEIELEAQELTEKDVDALKTFVSDDRKRLFIFKIKENEPVTKQLALHARRTVLNKTAETILKNSSNVPKINPLKYALNSKSPAVRPRIQIQKSILLPKPPSSQKDVHIEQSEHVVSPDLHLVSIDHLELPELVKQLRALGIESLQESAIPIIKEHHYAFRDGIIPNNPPKGFYIDKSKKAFCYTDTPRKHPSPLAPVLKKQDSLVLPSLEEATALLPQLSQQIISVLLDNPYSPNQKNTFLSLLPAYENEIKALLQLRQNDEFIIPFLCKQYVLGGEAHSILLIRLITACLNKKINLEFLETPEVQNALLSTRGIKNLQKLAQLPAEQKEWWNTLVAAHLKYDKNSFDFNVFFEAYTQIFLPRIAEKNLTLPNPCPIKHDGHILVTLNRVLDVIEHAKNPQEQCLSLSNLNWSSTGVHYAMLQKKDAEQLKQVAACMQIETPEDCVTDPERIYLQLINEDLQLKPWLFRYMGQHWKTEIRLSDIQAQLLEIEKLASWTSAQKNQLTFILTCAFSNKDPLNVAQWRDTLSLCISALQPLEQNDRTDLLQEFSRAFKFKPNLSFAQINTLMSQCIEFKTAFPGKRIKDDFITPLVSCLENEGMELFTTLQERIQKTDPAPETNQFSLSAIASFTEMLQKNRQTLPPELIKLLAKLNEANFAQEQIDLLLLAIKAIQDTKGPEFHRAVLSTLSQINISKSQELPKIDRIQSLLETFVNSEEIVIPAECNTPEKQEEWLKALIVDKNLLPGCVLGNGDISKLDDLIVDALADAIKKRSAVFKVDLLKSELQKNLQSRIVPQQLRDKLDKTLMPLFDTVNDLFSELQKPNPQFSEALEKFKTFEEEKPKLLEETYGLSILGIEVKTQGEYILSFLLTGERKETDKTTGSGFAAVLGPVHNLLVSQMRAFFENPKHKQSVKDLDLNTCLGWMAKFNETLSLTFFFKEELIQKKVLPALKKTLHQLNTQDPDFERSILDEAAIIDENAPSHIALQNYKNKIESIANYLNLLIDINSHHPQQFNKIYKQLSTGALTRLNYAQKHILAGKLIKDSSEKLDLYLKLTTQALEENPAADDTAIERAINGLVDLFRIADLEPETETMFFKMSLAHNLRNASPFPLAALNKFKKSNLPEEIKSSIIKKIIQFLVGLSGTNSELVHGLIQQTQLFLTENQDQAELCIALLNRVSHKKPDQDLTTYPLILQQLAQIDPENRVKIATILCGLANNKKDSTVNLPALLELTQGLGRRPSVEVDRVLKLFATKPYPNTQSLNLALGAHDSEKIRAYCLSFDTNPFAKAGEQRDLAKQFATDRIKDALLSLQDLLHETDFPHALQMQLAKQLTYIETLGYTDPLNPNNFTGLKKLTACSRHDLKERACTLLQQLRSKAINQEQVEETYLELLAYLREIYFRTTGLFPNTTQMLVLLLALKDPSSNLLMRIKTGEGKSINTPMLSVLQWAQGGTVVQWTANPTLLIRDYENSCEPFFSFLGIRSALIQSNTPTKNFIHEGINCSTVEDMASFHLAAKIDGNEDLLKPKGPVHIVLDECDDALLDQLTLYKLVAEAEAAHGDNPAQWIYPIAYQFVKLPAFRKTNPAWDEDEDLDQFRIFLSKQINEQFNGDVDKQNYLMASSNTQLKQWIHASCIAATLVENKHFIMQPVKEKDETGHDTIKKIACVPLIRSTPKLGSIFTEEVQQALQARLKAERKDQAQYIFIDPVPSVLASQSAQGLIKFFQKTLGRLLGISATPGDKLELESLATSLGIQAVSVAPHAGDKRINHDPIFTFDREGTIKAIHETFNKIKCPVTKVNLEIKNPNEEIQTHEQQQKLFEERREAIQEWSYTQTQPILIVSEDFDEAQAIGNSLKEYEKQGFIIQVITGKESPEQLEKLIEQAGKVNTITVGTAMLAKGIDINPGNHPKGLFVIQTYPDTERMTTQIGGRAARNGKPGEWLPIYQVKPPQNLLDQFLYYVFPWTRQRINEQSVEVVRNKIKLQATVDRIYTQAIDEAQQILIQQIEAWESLICELYPDKLQIKFELYQWREALLSELTRSQDTNVTESSLTESIEQFKKSACRLWGTALEEKWAAKAEKAPHMSYEQGLRLKFLKQLDFSQELNIQTKLQQKGKQFSAGAKALMYQNLETIIADKAGAVLEYTKPSDQTKKSLELAQSKQVLPYLVGAFCTVCPEAIKTLFPKNTSQNGSFVPEINRKAINKLIEQKNRVWRSEEKQEVTESIIQFYQKKLMEADDEPVKLLSKVKPLILSYCSQLNNFSLVEQFKVQGMVLSFSTLYRNLGLPEDESLNTLKKTYDEEIMKKLAKYLIDEFDWVQKKPEPFHAYFERTVAKNAALEIYNLAKELDNVPQDKDKIQELYSALERHKAVLKDKYLFSISHSSPRNVINDALDAIDSLNNIPHCDLDFRKNCHDKIVAEHQINAFRNCLGNTSPYFFKTVDPTWTHLKETLLKMSRQSKDNPSHVVHELYEAIERFSSYNAYQPYLKQLNALKKQLAHSIGELGKSDGLHQDVQESLFAQKQNRFANLLKVNPEHVRIQNGTDGIQSYIELQIEDEPLQQGFTGYESSFLKRVEAERNELRRVKTVFEENKNNLLNLSDAKAIETLPERKRPEFERLFKLKELLNLDWNHLIIDHNDFPELIRKKLEHADELKHLNWKVSPVNLHQLRGLLGKEPDGSFTALLDEQSKLKRNLEGIRSKIRDIQEQIELQEKEKSDTQHLIKTAQDRMQESNCPSWEWYMLKAKNHFLEKNVQSFEKHLETLSITLSEFQGEETECMDAISDNDDLLDGKRIEFISGLFEQIKHHMAAHLVEEAKQHVAMIDKELQETEPAINKIADEEIKKSRYQTRRFFKTSELLRYEALLTHEQEMICGNEGPIGEFELEDVKSAAVSTF
ncbi:hypothetical protein [Legionella cherrii]|uniref:hypothetical protein n=1 Tax=Legionella cherrii TaxID=28084 RepID=UPI000688EABF|nr:hypothetical protein [Legionella cherrii]